MKTWRRRKAQEFRKRTPHARCVECGCQTENKVFPTDWSFAGYIVKRFCDECDSITLIGPAQVLERIKVVEDQNLGETELVLLAK